MNTADNSFAYIIIRNCRAKNKSYRHLFPKYSRGPVTDFTLQQLLPGHDVIGLHTVLAHETENKLRAIYGQMFDVLPFQPDEGYVHFLEQPPGSG